MSNNQELKNPPERRPPGPIDALKRVLDSVSVKQQFENALKENSSLFVSSIIDLVGSETGLQKCNPGLVVKECLKAATLKLPINKNLGFAWIIPYKEKGTPTPQFQMGYRGYIQLGLRTGQYKYLNADMIYDGEKVEINKLNGSVEIFGEQENDTVLGYFAHMETIFGFRKTIFWTKERITEHAKKYSKSWGRKDSAWSNEFNKMAMKTLIKELISKWGVMSVELIQAFDSDRDDMTFDGEARREAEQNENSDVIDINQPPPPSDDPDDWMDPEPQRTASGPEY